MWARDEAREIRLNALRDLSEALKQKLQRIFRHPSRLESRYRERERVLAASAVNFVDFHFTNLYFLS